ncbi:MAG: GNAT family N-acetyltransferase [Ferruginibacter sp.]
MELTWTYKSFHELAPAELYSIMELRNEVFVVEQNCVYQDADNKDQESFHFMAWDNKNLAAYCRILPPGLAFSAASIGRVVSAPAYRKSGCGRKLMEQAIEKTLNEFDCKIIMIGAQLYLKKFYESLGFVQFSETYLEDNIPHIKMQVTA